MEGALVGVAVARPGEHVSGGEIKAAVALEMKWVARLFTSTDGTELIKAALALEMPSSYIPSEWHLRGAMPLGSGTCPATRPGHVRDMSRRRDAARLSRQG